MTVSALNMKPADLGLAVLVIAGLYWVTHRSASAGQGGLPGYGRSPLNPSAGVQGANSQFFVTPSAPGSLGQQAATAAQNYKLLSGAFGSLQNWLSPLQASVTSAVPGDMRLSEKASYDVAPAADTLATGDFARMDRNTAITDFPVNADTVAANGPQLTDPADLQQQLYDAGVM